MVALGVGIAVIGVAAFFLFSGKAPEKKTEVVASSSGNERLEAMAHAEKLLTYLENSGDKAGADSVRAAITAVWADRKAQ